MKGLFKRFFTKKHSKESDEQSLDGRGVEQEPKSPPLELYIESRTDDDLSTLADPAPQTGTMTAEEAWKEYGTHSISSIDHDYKMAQIHRSTGGARSDRTMSSDGLTLGDHTNGTYSYRSQAGYSTNPSLFQDSSIENSSYTQSLISDRPNRDEVIHILAPPGKLGMSIETPDDGIIIVHGIKTTSPIFDELKVGDRILALDDEDVRFYTALKISKMITNKSSNKVRKLTVIRTIPLDNDEEYPEC